MGAPTVESNPGGRGGYSLAGIDCKFLIFFCENLIFAVNYVYFQAPVDSYVKCVKLGVIAVTSLWVPRRWNQIPGVGESIVLLESITNFLYFSVKT